MKIKSYNKTNDMLTEITNYDFVGEISDLLDFFSEFVRERLHDTDRQERVNSLKIY